MIKAIIIEDEEFAIRRLNRLLVEIDADVDILVELNSIEDSVQWLQNNQCELIFLDINLSDGNAFKIFELIEITTPIIFTTAYHEYALRAFDQYSIDYLLKPVSREKLTNSIQKYRTLREGSSTSNELAKLQDFIGFVQKQNTTKRFIVNIGNRVKVIEASDVAYFVSDTKLVFLYTFEGKRYTLDSSLKQIHGTLPQNDFYRVNRQYLLNRRAIEELYYFSATRVKVFVRPESKEDIILSRDKIGSFKRWLAG